jgi:hypothetical protein
MNKMTLHQIGEAKEFNQTKGEGAYIDYVDSVMGRIREGGKKRRHANLADDISTMPTEWRGICYLASAGCNGAKSSRIFENVCSTEIMGRCIYRQNNKPVQKTEPDKITYLQLIISGGQA